MQNTMTCPRADAEFLILENFIKLAKEKGAEEFNTPTNTLLSGIWRTQIMILEELEIARLQNQASAQHNRPLYKTAKVNSRFA